MTLDSVTVATAIDSLRVSVADVQAQLASSAVRPGGISVEQKPWFAAIAPWMAMVVSIAVAIISARVAINIAKNGARQAEDLRRRDLQREAESLKVVIGLELHANLGAVQQMPIGRKYKFSTAFFGKAIVLSDFVTTEVYQTYLGQLAHLSESEFRAIHIAYTWLKDLRVVLRAVGDAVHGKPKGRTCSDAELNAHFNRATFMADAFRESALNALRVLPVSAELIDLALSQERSAEELPEALREAEQSDKP